MRETVSRAKTRRESDYVWALIEEIERTAEVLDVGGGLTAKHAQPSVKQTTMDAAQRQAISAKLMRKDPNIAAARRVGVVSLRQLAKRLGVTASFLSQVRSGTRPMPDALAAKFKTLTGQNWL